MAACPTCQAEIVSTRVLEVRDEAGHRALVSCAGCLSILDVALQDLGAPFEEWPYRAPHVVVAGSIATRLLSRLEGSSNIADELAALDATTSLVLRLPEVFRFARTLYVGMERVETNQLCMFVCPSIREDRVSLLMRAPAGLAKRLRIVSRRIRDRRVLAPDETAHGDNWALLEGATLSVRGATESGLLCAAPPYLGDALPLRALEAPLDVLRAPVEVDR